ncbi:hypothetical protein ACFO0M_15390 [Micromonospora mangrovi]|uniref:Nitroreductase domain-containing protein n=2 Tax=Micromonospora TaxID=1873 RepID=A0AAU7MCF5_9ACTN
MTDATETLRFALRQGPLRGILHDPIVIDESVPTTALIPPAAARGESGRPLPLGTTAALAATTYPAGRLPAGPACWQRLGAVLLAAFGLQRREPSNPANDHRVTASVRSKFPVHVFVVPPAGPAAYLDVYRHALVDVGGVPVPPPLRPDPGEVTVVLAARHTDLPAPYGALRCALTDLETGINLRSLLVAAELAGLGAVVASDGPTVTAAADLAAATGPGSWAAPVTVVLRGAGALPEPVDLPATTVPDDRLPAASADRTLADLVPIVRHRVARAAATGPAVSAGAGAPGIPDLPAGTGPSWEQVLWRRSAGRVRAPLTGFSARPARADRAFLDDLLGWAAVPAPTDRLRAVGERVGLGVVLHHVADLPTGWYTIDGTTARPGTLDDRLPARIEQSFGYPLSTANDCGVRHALAICVLTVDLRALVTDLGDDAWGLLQVWCGWVAHGFSMAAAAHGLFARPARSFDEHHLGALLDLPAGQAPVLMTVCGRSAYAEPLLDLRA